MSAFPISPDGQWHYLISYRIRGYAGVGSCGYATPAPILATSIDALTDWLTDSVNRGPVVIDGVHLLAGPAVTP